MPTKHPLSSFHSTHQNADLPFSTHPRLVIDNMASPKYQTKDNILPISNEDFFRHHHCPMRAVNTRCQNFSACERVHFGDQAAPQKAVKIRDQIIQQIESSKHEASMPDSRIWADIEPKVVKLMKWVLCQKHMPHYNAATSMVIRFLKEENGVFVEEQSAQMQLRSKEAAINDNSASPEVASAAPYSTCASAASHLATPPISTGTLAHQRCFASHDASSLKNGAASDDTSLNPAQQSAFVLHMNMPLKTERSNQIQDMQSQPVSNSTTPRSAVKSEFPPGTRPSKQNRVPYGFHVRSPSRTRQAAGIDSARGSRTEPTRGKSTVGLTVRDRFAERASVAHPCLSKTFKQPTSTNRNHRDSLDVAGQDDPVQAPRSEVSELAEKFRAVELCNEELEDRILRLEDNNQRLLVANKQLLEVKKYYKELYQDTKDRLGEVEGEHDGLEDELAESREHIVKLQEELAMLRRPARGRSLRRRAGQ